MQVTPFYKVKHYYRFKDIDIKFLSDMNEFKKISSNSFVQYKFKVDGDHQIIQVYARRLDLDEDEVINYLF